MGALYVFPETCRRNYCFYLFQTKHRTIQDLKRKAESDTENTLSKLSAVEAEKTSVAMQVADVQAENSQLRGEISALRKAQKWVTLC